MSHPDPDVIHSTDSLATGFRLSPQQKRLWRLHQANPAYRVRGAYEIDGALDYNRLRSAVRQVAQSHDILRAGFTRQPGTTVPVQACGGETAVWDDNRDFSGLPDEEQTSSFERFWLEQAERRVRWEYGPALRWQLVRLGDEKHRLLVDLSPLCGDATTLNLLVRAVAAAYAAQRETDAYSYAGLQYPQFAEWQNSLIETPDPALDEARAYWSSQPLALQGEGMPVRKDLPGSPAFDPARIEMPIEADLLAAIAAGAADLDMTEPQLLFASWCIYLWRWTQDSAGSVGYVADGRPYDELGEVMGLVARCLPVAQDIDARLPFRAMAARVQERLQEALEWQDYFPFDATSSAGEDLLPVLDLGFEHLKLPAPELVDGRAWSICRQDVVLEPFQLKLECIHSRDGLRAALVYDAGLYDQSTAERLLQGWLALIRDVVLEPEKQVGRLQLMGESERTDLLIRFNETARPYPDARCLHDLFVEQARQTPEAIAIRCADETLSYGELDARSDGLAAHLAEIGAGPEQRVAICLRRCPDLLVAILGTLKAGSAYVPLDSLYPLERLAQILEDARPSVLLTETGMLDRLPAFTAPTVCLDEHDWDAPAALSQVAAQSDPDHLAYVIYTSGSTGQPKGVMVPHRGLVNYLRWCVGAYQVSGGCGTLVDTPIGFDLTITSLLSPLVAGQTMVLVPEENGVEALTDALSCENDLTLVKTTPAHLEGLRNLLPPDSAAASRLFVIGGEALRWDTLSFWKFHSPQTRLINEYGPTETVVGCCVYEVPERLGSGISVPIGRPIANARLYLLDPNLQPVPMGMAGELYVGGDGLARGYLGQPDLTAERFVPDAFSGTSGARLYKTGDLCRFLPDGNLEYLGRMDHQVKIRGFRIELGEIESVLIQHAGVRDAAALAREDRPGDKRLVAYVVTAPGQATPGVADLQGYLSKKLPEYMVPGAFVFLNSLPLTPNGKVDRKALPAPESSAAIGTAQYVAPRTPVEMVLADIWAEVLGAEEISVHEDFFEMGGHSLLATQLILRVRETFQVDVPLRAIFDAPSAASFAELILLDPVAQPLVEEIAGRIVVLSELSEEELEVRMSMARASRDAL